MSLLGAVAGDTEEGKEHSSGRSSVARLLYNAGLSVWNTVTSRYPIGTNVFDREWDVLIVLDACRADMIPEITEELDQYDSAGKIWSVGSMSAEWVLNTFRKDYREEISRTAHVSGNIWSHNIFSKLFHEHSQHKWDYINRGFPKWKPVSEEEFKHFELVHPVANQADSLHPDHHYNYGSVPHVITDRAISVGREKDFDRMIVHYMIPHMCFLGDALDWDPEDPSTENLMSGPEPKRGLYPYEKSYEPAENGEVSLEKVRKAYSSHLKLGMAYINILLNNIDAEKVAITADHGEGFGEYGFWGHPFGWPLPPVKTVPWITTTATDRETYEPQYDQLENPPTDQQIEEHLKELGYI